MSQSTPAGPAPGSESKPPLAAPHPASSAPGFGLSGDWRLPGAIIVAALGLALLGFALTSFSPKDMWWYWVVALPAIGALCIWHTWMSVRDPSQPIWPQIRKQVLHWLGLLIALKIVFILGAANTEVSGEAISLVALLLVALACFLAGVHFDWVFLPVGIVLGGCVLMASFLVQYIWVALIALGLAFILMFGLYRMTGRGAPVIVPAPPKRT